MTAVSARGTKFDNFQIQSKSQRKAQLVFRLISFHFHSISGFSRLCSRLFWFCWTKHKFLLKHIKIYMESCIKTFGLFLIFFSYRAIIHIPWRYSKFIGQENILTNFKQAILRSATVDILFLPGIRYCIAQQASMSHMLSKTRTFVWFLHCDYFLVSKTYLTNCI